MVFDKVKQIISEQFNISENEITLALSFIRSDKNTCAFRQEMNCRDIVSI